MEPTLFSQEGMEISCRKFNQRILSESDERGDSFNGFLHPQYVSCDFATKTLRLAYDITPAMRNPAGVMHGGAIAGALDVAMGSLTFYMSGEFLTPTISMTTSYERPVPTGARMIVESTCLSCGKTMAYATAKAWMEDAPDKIVCSAAGTYYTASGMR